MSVRDLTVRERVSEIQKALRDEDVAPVTAREHLTTLTALIGNCNAELRSAEMAYNQRLLVELNADGPANRARIRAQTTDEYARLREAKDTQALVVEMVRSLKTVLRSIYTEMGLQR